MDDQNTPLELLDEEYEPDLIMLEDEAGEEHTFEVIDAADVDGVRYLAVVPHTPDSEEDAEMLLMRVGQDEDGSEYLDLVDDEDELSEIGDVFLNRLSEIYNIDLDQLKKELE